uniref:Predicted protein n=1 Tax=Hordeum vulgare subsp. vulgare TaxID=112509 RepID=F2E082_HORVV|nr:predicted protein [Hordeum vulgare subsp. vulgare]
MRVVLLLALCALAAAYSYPSSDFELDLNFAKFQEFTARFSKNYKSVEEYTTRYATFLDNLERVAKLNQDGRGVFGVTKFMDMTPAEFKATYLGFKPDEMAPPKAPVARPHRAKRNATGSVDWRTKGAVTPVKDQAQCGSCWAFSATEQIESNWFLAGNELISLSPQQIVSCDTTDGGCGGGWTYTAYQYVQSAGGLDTDAAYPYSSGAGVTGTCDNPLPASPAAQISGFGYAIPTCSDSCTNQDENSMAQYMQENSPLSVCVDAEPWQFYSSGIMTVDQCPSDFSGLDHCVQAVGYDATGSQPYWIVRNSWNTNWGEDGFIRLALGTNTCGIGDVATYVKI